MKLIKSLRLNHWRGILAPALFLAAACASGGSAANASPSAAIHDASPSPGMAMHHAALDVLSSRYGQVLVDGQGRALYLFAAETTTESKCCDACATAWPPMLADKGAAVGAMHRATGSLAGTTTRKDGTVQVTYNVPPSSDRWPRPSMRWPTVWKGRSSLDATSLRARPTSCSLH